MLGAQHLHWYYDQYFCINSNFPQHNANNQLCRFYRILSFKWITLICVYEFLGKKDISSWTESMREPLAGDTSIETTKTDTKKVTWVYLFSVQDKLLENNTGLIEWIRGSGYLYERTVQSKLNVGRLFIIHFMVLFCV